MNRTGIRRALVAIYTLATLATLLYTIGAPWDTH
jgi:hypothetical protein